ncbi:hypothetical protein COD14_30910 [Bacillus cereus]|nr:hypothetical protein COD14_30910 [Bacillus cereus]
MQQLSVDMGVYQQMLQCICIPYSSKIVLFFEKNQKEKRYDVQYIYIKKWFIIPIQRIFFEKIWEYNESLGMEIGKETEM